MRLFERQREREKKRDGSPGAAVFVSERERKRQGISLRQSVFQNGKCQLQAEQGVGGIFFAAK